jgi:rare lipoprotein A
MGVQSNDKRSAVRRTLAIALLCGAGLSACASPGPPRLAAYPSAGAPRVRAYNRPYEVHGQWYSPTPEPGYDVVGVASWYSYEAHNRTTADGEPFDARLATAAHKTLPIPSYLDVTNLDNGRRVRVRLNDRGPFVSGRIIDLSRGAAEQLGMIGRGTARVRVRYVGPAPPFHPGERAQAAPAPAHEGEPAVTVQLAQSGDAPGG